MLRERARVAVVDETAVNVGGHTAWLWLAIEPERRAVLALMLTHARNALVAYSLLRDLGRRGVRRRSRTRHPDARSRSSGPGSATAPCGE